MKFQERIKYSLDRLAALMLFLVLWPIFLAISLLIKLDDGGHVFFSQTRMGLGGKPFRIYKFRSMIADADEHLSPSGIATRNRVTRIGKFLRFTSLDELPQLFNILRGDMSFIGPRPGLIEHFERYTDEQKHRYDMKPGITGLAQVNGRNILPWSQRIAFDLKYIEKYSWWLDIKILVRTVKVVFFREGIVLDRNPEQVDDLSK